MSEEAISARRGNDESDTIAVMPGNWNTVLLFLASATQWRRAGMNAIATGLDYAGVEAAARLACLQTDPATFDGLRIMEAAALNAMREKQT
jgi:hypothetical protein